MKVRPATGADAPRLAELHAARIAEGFLASLGPPFLTRLYRRMTRADGSFAVVAEHDGGVVGFAAGSVALGRLYREFLVRDGLVAGAVAAPRLARSWRRVIETLRYPASADADLPGAEILAVAVDAAATGRGAGHALVDAALAELAARGVPAAKVVTGVDNAAALALYRRCGFVDRTTIEVHDGTPSQVLVWTAP